MHMWYTTYKSLNSKSTILKLIVILLSYILKIIMFRSCILFMCKSKCEIYII